MRLSNFKDWDGEDWFGCVVLCVALLGLGFGTFALVNVIRSDAKVDHCYVEYYNQSQVLPGTYIVKGHVPWRSDIVLGHAPTSEEAQAKLRDLCPAK